LKAERESQFNAAGGSEFQVRGAAVLNDRLLVKLWCSYKVDITTIEDGVFTCKLFAKESERSNGERVRISRRSQSLSI